MPYEGQALSAVDSGEGRVVGHQVSREGPKEARLWALAVGILPVLSVCVPST